jgi:hypothetical protein
VKSRFSPAVANVLLAISAWLGPVSPAAAQSNAITVTVEQTKTYPGSVKVDTDVRLHYHATARELAPASGCGLEWVWTYPEVKRDGQRARIAEDYHLIISSARSNSSELHVTFTPLKSGHWTLSARHSVTAATTCGAKNSAEQTQESKPVALLATGEYSEDLKDLVPTQDEAAALVQGGARIAQQNFVVTLMFHNCSTATLKVSMYNFTHSGALEFFKQIRHVRFNLYDAQQVLSNQTHVSDRIIRWFGGTDWATLTPTTKAATLTYVKQTYNGIISLLDNVNGTKYYDDPDMGAGFYGETPGQPGMTFTVGPKFWTGKPGVPIDLERFGTVIHELSHAVSDIVGWEITDVGGYFNNPGALQNAPVRWYEGGGNQVDANLVVPQPDNETLLEDADAYAGYFTQYYYCWGPGTVR